jgi:hypothetical protein
VVVVNTRNKRASAIGVGLAALVVLPAPDASVDQPDSQHVTFCYSGISAAALFEYDVIEFTSVTLTFATLTGVTLEPQ